MRERVGEVLELVGLRPDVANLFPHEFSGGQRQRIAIARALATDTRLIVLDEPVSALDVSIRAQIINQLEDLQRALGVSYLFIGHDLATVAHISHRIAVMYLGQIVETRRQHRAVRQPLAPLHPGAVHRRAAGPSRRQAARGLPSRARCRAPCRLRPAAASTPAARTPCRAAPRRYRCAGGRPRPHRRLPSVLTNLRRYPARTAIFTAVA